MMVKKRTSRYYPYDCLTFIICDNFVVESLVLYPFLNMFLVSNFIYFLLGHIFTLKCILLGYICVQGVIAEVPEIILRCISRDEAALAVAQKVYYLL